MKQNRSSSRIKKLFDHFVSLHRERVIWAVDIIILLVIVIVIRLVSNPEKLGLYTAIGTLVFSGISALLLLITAVIYKSLLEVTEQTLAFTKTQTSFNRYLDNYKLFDELSKRSTSIVLNSEINEGTPYFKNMTFISIHFNYINILQQFPGIGSSYVRDINYELVFKRFNAKIQSFIDTIFNEIVKINTDPNLSDISKTTLLDLYRNFVLSDYMGLCKDLIQNIEWFDGEALPPTEISNLLKCNTKDRIVFDTDKFLKLYFEVEKPIGNPTT